MEGVFALLAPHIGRLAAWPWLAVGLALALWLASTQPAHAYIDPGAGGTLIQFLLGGAVAAIFMLFRAFRRRLAAKIGWGRRRADRADEAASTSASDDSADASAG